MTTYYKPNFTEISGNSENCVKVSIREDQKTLTIITTISETYAKYSCIYNSYTELLFLYVVLYFSAVIFTFRNEGKYEKKFLS